MIEENKTEGTMREECGGGRIASCSRETKETSICVTINLDGVGKTDIRTGIGFFDHMLEGFARHGLFDMTVRVNGDLHIDCHHTIEDTGIVLGNAIKKALKDKRGIERYGHFTLPMDETLVLCAVDLCGRPYLNWSGDFTTMRLGDMDTQMIREFFYAVSYSSMANIHIKTIDSGNDHHLAEAMFKSFGRALHMAVGIRAGMDTVWSTKGSLS